MALCVSFGATLLTARITYELPADSERALGKRRERETRKLRAQRQTVLQKMPSQMLTRPDSPWVKSFTGQ